MKRMRMKMSRRKSLALITQNEEMRAILGRIDKVVDSDCSILLMGETGVGKEMFAEYVHRTSPRALRPLVKISLSALPPNLLESELFGHEKGAYTSAAGDKRGLFEIANGGSLFLDDIDDVPLAIQTKLLRVLESRELMRIGGTRVIPIDVRLICSSKVDLKDLVDRDVFRADLFYRINVVPIKIPPLRERRGDIPLLADHFFKMFVPEKEVKITPEALKNLIDYSWPGNVRELRNVVERMALFADGKIRAEDLPVDIRSQNSMDALVKSCKKCFVDGNMTFDQVVSCLEHNLLRDVLRESGGNQSRAAKALGLSLSTFRDKLKKYKLNNS